MVDKNGVRRGEFGRALTGERGQKRKSLIGTGCSGLAELGKKKTVDPGLGEKEKAIPTYGGQ